MKRIEWVGEDGKRHAAMVRDTDSDEVAKRGLGLPADPPDIELLDWDTLRCELHNQLLSRGLITQDDVVRQQNGVTAAILSTFKRAVLNLYRQGG